MASVNGFELYVWPTTPGAASLDPECIAVIVFLTRVLPRDAGLSIITTYDASISPSRTLPCLRRDDVCVHGSFRNFVKYFQLPGQGLDDGLDDRQQAEALALEYHLQKNAQPLLDYHLYINRDNYSYVTHRADSKYSYWPLGWLYPSRRYDKAERRAASIGLADQPLVKSGSAQDDTDPAAGGHLEASENPSLIFARSQKQQKKLKEQVSTARFRLQIAIDALCEPLDAALKRNADRFLIDGSVRTVDCRALGFLSLLLHAKMTDSTISKGIHERWPGVARYAGRVRSELSSAQIERLSSDLLDATVSDDLALSNQPPLTILRRASVFFTTVTDLIFPSHARTHLDYAFRSIPLTVPLLILGLFAASTGLATFSYAAYTLLSKKIPRDAFNQRSFTFARAKTGLGAMGASGAALSALFGPPSGAFDSGARIRQQGPERGGVQVTEAFRREQPGAVEVAEVDVELNNT